MAPAGLNPGPERTNWDEETQNYSSGRSTGQTTKAAAHRQVQKWLADGLPGAKKKDLKATKNRLVAAITKYLEDCEVINVNTLLLEQFIRKSGLIPRGLPRLKGRNAYKIWY
jgi:hypothetical protein